MRCHSVEALLCKAHRYICRGLLEAWINEFFFNCLWGSILEYWDYFEMKSRKTLWAWNICSIFMGNWNHVIRLTTFVRRYVMYKHQKTERYQCNFCLGQAAGYGITIISGQKTRYENSKYDLLFAEDVVWIIGLFLVVYVSKRPIFHLSLSRSWHLSLCMKAKPLGEALKRFCFRQASRNKTTRMDQLRVSKNAHPD